MQGLAADGAIESDERALLRRPVVARSEDGAQQLGDRYWLEVTRGSRGIVRRRLTASGVELRLLWRGPCLLRFGRPETSFDASAVTCRYPILGGLLARRPGGWLTLTQIEQPEPELRAAVNGFLPRLSSRLYEHVQRRLHLAISRRYFVGLVAEAQR